MRLPIAAICLCLALPWGCMRSTALSVGGAGAGVAAEEPRPTHRRLRVMSYNIKHGQSNEACQQPPAPDGEPPFADCSLDLPGTLTAIRAYGPEVVALQEVDRGWARSDSRDQAVLIAEGLEMRHHCFGANLDHPPDRHAHGPHQYGTAIVSRYPIVECVNMPLTTFEGWEQRGLLRAAIDVHGVRAQVYSTHLQASRTVGGVSQSGAPQRVLQVQDILRELSSVGDPLVLMGDFNAGSTSTEMRPLTATLRDVWREAGAGAGNTSPARLDGDPTSRIDYIFVSPDVTIWSAQVPITPLTRRASDHYPVVAHLALPLSRER